MKSPTENRPPKRSGLGPDAPEREPERPAISKETPMKTRMRLAVAAALLISGRFLPAATLTVLYSFDGVTGDFPTAALIQGSDGDFYGTTTEAVPDTCLTGDVFKIDATGVFTELHFFLTCSVFPDASLIQASDGFFYGTTEGGGANLEGSVFKIDSTGVFTDVHSFNGADGSQLTGAVVEGTDGNFYGTSRTGGAHGGGTVFKMTPSGTVTTLHSFNAGANPLAGLILASDGLFYGTTESGGTHHHGSIFKITSSGTFTQIHSFNGNDGSDPKGPLLQASDGNFYGTTYDGGSHNVGVIFRVDSSGTLNVLVNFTNNAHPIAGLIQLPNGLLYGTTSKGGKHHYGAIFKVNPSSGTYTRIFSFSGTDGALPIGELLLGSDGLLYGTTASGGANGFGEVFSFSTPISSPAISDTPSDDGPSAEDE
jgi:uncharacterized repeat protein (TIGR03803 family)